MPRIDAPDLAQVVSGVPLGAEAEALGRVEEIADGLARVSGLHSAAMGEVLIFEGAQRGFVLMLDEDVIQAVLLDSGIGIEAGSEVRRSGHLVSVPVGEGLLGRTIDPLGRPLDEGAPIEAADHLPIERPAPDIIDRGFVTQPVQTGVLAIDALFAVGRGQRELILGDRATGKTALGVDAILNQKDGDMICIYVAIGQRATAVHRVIDALREKGNPDRCIFVVAPATAEPGMRWLAPFAAMSMAEHFRDNGQDVLMVMDDLTKHATTHRELSLLARQPAGREAYPADIFFLHARLLERAAKLSDEKGGGSITALPIVEIEEGNLSGYIPTNLISISDGQIVLSSKLFAANQRPAVDIGLSVSRVGGKAQLDALKAVAGQLRLEYAQYLELRVFSRFGGFGDAKLKARIAHGERISALLAQPRYSPLRPIDQIALIAGLNAGNLDAVPLEAVPALKQALPGLIDAEPRLAAVREAPGDLSNDDKVALAECLAQAIARVGQG